MGKSKKQTIGYRYFMGLHMAVCHGPVDSIDQIYVGKRSLEIAPTTINSTALVDQRELFGGDKKEGGIYGNVDFEFGADDQTVNPYLASQFGAETPAFKGVTCVVFRKGDFVFGSTLRTALGSYPYLGPSGGGFVASMSPYPKPWAFAVTDIPGGTFNPSKQNVGGGANGGHIIYDCLTNTDWGMGVPAADVDATSFTSATDQLFLECFGLHLIYAQQSSMKEFINVVLNHINGILYTDRSTGKFVLKLIRPGCDPLQVPVFDETNIISLVSFERPSFAEIVNEVTVVYRRRGELEDTSVTVQDLASVQAQGGIVSQTVSYPGIDAPKLAGRVALRDLNSLGTPLARVKLVLNREAWEISPGDTMAFSWGVYGLSQMILRVLAVNYGTFESGVVMVDCIEDIFNMPNTSYIDPVESGWEEEVAAPVPAPTEIVFELPYFVIQTTFDQEDLDALAGDTAFLATVAEAPPIATTGYSLATRIGSNEYTLVDEEVFSPTCQLTATLDRQTKIDIPIKNFKGSIAHVVIGGFAFLNNETLRIDAIDTDTNLISIGRGFTDSLPAVHEVNNIIYFADGATAVDPTDYIVTDTVDAKLLTRTGQGTLPLSAATELTHTLVGRRVRPYPPAQVKIEAGYFPASVGDTTVNVTWTHQDRTQQLVETGGSDWFETALGSQETGVLYDVRYYNDDTSTLLSTDAGVSGTASSYTPSLSDGNGSGTFNMRIEIDAIRSATETNFVTFSHTFLYSIPDTGTLVASDSVVVASGVVQGVDTGVLLASDSVVAASGTAGRVGNGLLISADSVVTGSGAIVGPVTGTGSLVSADSTVSGSGQLEHTGTGSLVSADSTLSGTGSIGAVNNRTLENGDNRTLENGDNRTTE